jgi:hypothetical protein
VIRPTKGQSLLGAVYSLLYSLNSTVPSRFNLFAAEVSCHQMTSMFAHSGAAVTPHVVMKM